MDAEVLTPGKPDTAQENQNENQSVDRAEMGEDEVFGGDTLPGLSGEGPISEQDTFMRQVLIPMMEEQERQQREAQKKKKEAGDHGPETAGDTKEPVREEGTFNGRTAFHEMAKKVWGNEDVAGYLIDELARHAKLDKVKQTANGFEIELNNGQKVRYGVFQRQDGNSFEAVVGDPKKFDDSAASAMVLMSRVHGWNVINVHGSQDQKEKLWLAVQRQALVEYKQFTKLQAEGVIGKDETFNPPVVGNFEPDRNSKVYKQAMKELAAFEKEHGKIGAGQAAETPAVEKAEPAPEQETKAEAKAEAPVEAKPVEAVAPVEAKAAAPKQKAEEEKPAEAAVKTEAKAETAAEVKTEAKAETAPAPKEKVIDVQLDLDNNRAVVSTRDADAPAPARLNAQEAAVAAAEAARARQARAPSPTDLPASVFLPEAIVPVETKAAEKPAAEKPAAEKPASQGTDKSKFAAAVAAKGGHNKPGTKTASAGKGPAPRHRKDADPGRSVPPKGSAQAKGAPKHRRGPTP